MISPHDSWSANRRRLHTNRRRLSVKRPVDYPLLAECRNISCLVGGGGGTKEDYAELSLREKQQGS